jgi:hypothetical protein
MTAIRIMSDFTSIFADDFLYNVFVLAVALVALPHDSGFES